MIIFIKYKKLIVACVILKKIFPYDNSYTDFCRENINVNLHIVKKWSINVALYTQV